MPGEYRLVFDVAEHSSRIEPWIFAPVLLTGIGALLVFKPALMQKLMPHGLQGRARRIFSWAYFLFALVITATFALSNLTQAHGLRASRSSDQHSATEGCLQAFHPMPSSGHDMERLRINDRCFAYSDFIITPAFHQTESHGGPVHADSKLRLLYAGGAIIRMEVADHACPSAPDDPQRLSCRP